MEGDIVTMSEIFAFERSGRRRRTATCQGELKPTGVCRHSSGGWRGAASTCRSRCSRFPRASARRMPMTGGTRHLPRAARRRRLPAVAGADRAGLRLGRAHAQAAAAQARSRSTRWTRSARSLRCCAQKYLRELSPLARRLEDSRTWRRSGGPSSSRASVSWRTGWSRCGRAAAVAQRCSPCSSPATRSLALLALICGRRGAVRLRVPQAAGAPREVRGAAA